MRVRFSVFASVLAACLFATTSAHAASTFDIDHNDISVTVNDVGGTGLGSSDFEGSIELSGGTTEVFKFGSTKVSGADLSFSGTVFLDGQVLDTAKTSSFTFTDTDGNALTFDVGSPDIANGMGLLFPFGTDFFVMRMDGASEFTFDSSSEVFAGQDVSNFAAAEPFPSSVFTFGINESNKLAGLEYAAVVPSPTAVAAAAPLLALIGLIRPRRRA